MNTPIQEAIERLDVTIKAYQQKANLTDLTEREAFLLQNHIEQKGKFEILLEKEKNCTSRTVTYYRNGEGRELIIDALNK